MNVYAETHGVGPDLVLLHGWGFNLNIWSSIVTPLQQCFRLTLVDLPGFGRSKTMPAEYTLSAIVDEIIKVMPQRAIYMAWSLGSLVAQQLAINKPQRVSQLISVCASPRLLVAENWPGVSVDLLQQFKRGIENNPKKMLKRFASMLSLSDQQPKQLSQLLYEKILQYGLPQRQALLAGLQILSDTDLRSQCRHLQCPQNYILGDQDLLVHRSMPAAIKQMMPASDVEQIDGAGHIPFMTHTQRFLQIVSQLIQIHA